MKLPIGEGLKKATLDPNYISNETIEKIKDIIRPSWPSDRKLEFIYLNEDISWVKKDPVSLVVRLEKYLYRHYKVKLSAEAKTAIGNLIGGKTQPRTVYVDFVQEVEWSAGEFGDEGSCLWEMEFALDEARKNGFLAMRVFEECAEPLSWLDYKGYKGIGRCFIYPLPKEEYLVFNGYGFNGGTKICSDILQTFLNYNGNRKTKERLFFGQYWFFVNQDTYHLTKKPTKRKYPVIQLNVTKEGRKMTKDDFCDIRCEPRSPIT